MRRHVTPEPVPEDFAALDSLSVGVVVHRLDHGELQRTLTTLREAMVPLDGVAVSLDLIDNSDDSSLAPALARVAAESGWPVAHVRSGHGNVGYGRGHNLAIRASQAAAHLVLNPDVEVDTGALQAALSTLAQPGVVLVGAVGRDGAGHPAHLSKRMPSVWVLFLRGFAPHALRRRFAKRLAHYEYHDLATDRVSDVMLVSGAFMLARTSVLQAVGGFDERYFLHFEDLDLSLRMATQGRVVSDPRVTLIHHGGHSARKGVGHVLRFARSGVRFFRTHGWRWR